MSAWIPLALVCATWNVRPYVALRRIEAFVATGAVEFDKERIALRITWPPEIIASFAEIQAGSMTEG